MWTDEETQFLLENAESMTMSELSEKLGKTKDAIRGKKERLKISYHFNPLSYEEKQLIKEFYINNPYEIDLDSFSKKLSRPKTSICRYAHKEGLTKETRSFTEQTKQKISDSQKRLFDGEKGNARRELLSEKSKEWFKTHDHPRGMLNKNHTDASKAKISIGQSIYANSLTKEQRKERARKAVITRRKLGIEYKTTSNAYSRCKGGYRPDLHQYFRSSWEANIARILNELGINWEYETKRFYFNQTDNNVMSYQPDFYLSDFDKWIEVKGWMDPKSKLRLERFSAEYPDENKKLILIDPKFYYDLAEEYDWLDNWESANHYYNSK